MKISVPVLRKVDVVIAGASSGAVEAACAARRSGATVFCFTPVTFPGEDIARPFRYWPDRSRCATALSRKLFDPALTVPPSPMHVKRTLEREMIQEGVEYLYMSYPAFLLRDSSGVVSGIVMANRSGFQAVIAGALVDATPRAVVARMTGARFTPWAAGPIDFRRIVVGGEPVAGIPCAAMQSPVQIEGAQHPAFEYTFGCDMPDPSPGSFARAETLARLATWQPKMMLGADELFFTPADRLVSGGRMVDVLGEAPDLDAFRCGTDPVYILGPCGNVSDDVARELSEVGPLTSLGFEVGSAAARLALSRPVTGAVTVDYRDAAPAAGIDVVRHDSYFRLDGAECVEVDVNRLPRLRACDVLVAGGGTAGAPAAIAAARSGSRALLLESLPGLGGVSTEGRIARYYHGNRVGFTAEMDLGIHDMAPGCEFPLGDRGWNTEWKKQWYLREAHAAGADIWFGALCVAAARDGARVCGAAVATPYAAVGLVSAGCVVDSTGNADVAAAAGAECVVISGAHMAVQGTGLSPLRPGKHYTNTDHTFVDDTDVSDITRAFTLAREKFRECFDLAQIIDSRQRRQIRGDIELDALDFLAKRTFPDTVTIARSNFDSHGFTIHPVFMAKAPDKQSHTAHVPFRSLLPRGLERILVTGLGVSAHRDALPVIRMQPDVQNQGYAAGRAAAMAVQGGCDLRQIDMRQLQRHLVEKGILDAEQLVLVDSFPLKDDVIQRAVDEGAGTHMGLAAIFAYPERSAPMLRKAFAETADTSARLRFAHILGLLGDPTGVDTLIDTIDRAEWDKGWRFTGMGQFGFSLSPLDSMIIALARTGDPRGIPALLRKCASLAPDREFSHFRALTLAFEAMPAREAAPYFAAFLDHEQNRGNARESVAAALGTGVPDDPIDTTERNRELKELHIARGLYACGDMEGRARAVLEAYSRDLHGHYARHARAILSRSVTGEKPIG